VGRIDGSGLLPRRTSTQSAARRVAGMEQIQCSRVSSSSNASSTHRHAAAVSLPPVGGRLDRHLRSGDVLLASWTIVMVRNRLDGLTLIELIPRPVRNFAISG